jgi:uncharacterized membrane protein
METIYQIFKSWKTSGTGAVGFIIWLCAQFGIGLDVETANAFMAVIVFILALLAKDGTASHTQE